MKNYKSEVKWAVIFAIMTLLWTALEKAAGFHDERIAQQPIFGAFILIPAIIIYFLALKEKRSTFYEGVMTYRQGLLSGLILSVLIGMLSLLTTAINMLVISPDYFSNAISYAVASGTMTQQQAEAQFTLANYLVPGAIAAVITGVVIAAVLMLFLKRPHPVRQTTSAF